MNLSYAQTLNIIGLVYFGKNDNEKALEYFLIL